MSDELGELKEALGKATGPDRLLDARIHVALCQPKQSPDDNERYRLPHVSFDEMDQCAPGTYWLVQRSGRSLRTAPDYTASIAALALVEAKLREPHFTFSGPVKFLNIPSPVPNYWWAEIIHSYPGKFSPRGWGATAPLALLSALLNALSQKDAA